MSRAEKKIQSIGRAVPLRQSEDREKKRIDELLQPQSLRYLTYEITEEPMPTDPAVEAAIADQREELYDLALDNPTAAIPKLQKLLAQFPDSPLLLNWLSVAYLGANQREQYEQAVRLNYERNPNYLFARLNLAHIEMEAGRTERVPEIFDHQFDLKLLYPERDVFHLSEFINFCALMAEYYARTGDFDAADTMVGMLEQTAPDHRMTAQIKQVVGNAALLHTMDKVIVRFKNPRKPRKSWKTKGNK